MIIRILVFLLAGLPILLKAQDHKHHMPAENKKKADTAEHHMHYMEEENSMNMMSHSFSRNLPMNRNGSGTSWLPDKSPVYAYMLHGRSWTYMLHGNIFFRYNMQNLNNNFERGGKQFDVPNWIMGMAQHPAGKRGLFNFKLMLSADAFTVGGNGYPLLFQSGETWNNQPLVDRQHPHDLFAELSAAYTFQLNRNADVFIYAGYPGEPALGPVAFMHRISSINNPDAPLGHHWQDATHITFGVATLGIRYKNIKLEGSSFTGREPDENRYDFDRPRFDSYSYRLSIQPVKNISLQASQGFIKSPELLHPEDVTRTTASIDYAGSVNTEKHFTSSLIWGMNDKHNDREHSFLAEANFQFKKNAVYGRYEWVQKSVEELNLLAFEEQTLFNVNTLTLGYNRKLFAYKSTDLVAGIQGTVSSALNVYYGDNPLSAEVYIRVSPSLLRE